MESQSKQSIMEVATEYPKVIKQGGEMHWKTFGLQKRRDGLLRICILKVITTNVYRFITKSFIPLKAEVRRIKEVRKNCSLLLMGPITK